MANYLPVLLVSVSTNAVPDDSSLSTLPRGQVDYLSHDWEEEDVWRSWRNMTRQKNEIANGVRLENASWRTWWKQRNKLKTVTPETLNWLKDSDVTWLYGPLHTAVDWTPPPKPDSVPDSVESSNPASAHDRLDLSSHKPRKTILKYRSISELLTSDLPTSPVFSPAESDDEEDRSNIQPDLRLLSQDQFKSHKRPSLMHTKSDTHISRWGPSRAFRKDSPPRLDPPVALPVGSPHKSIYFPSSVRASHSQDSNSSAGGSAGSTERTQQKKKHISFNTFVEQCIAIEKPKKSSSGLFLGQKEGMWAGGRRGWDEDNGYDEDEEDSAGEDDTEIEAPWDIRPLHGSAVGSDSDSPYEEEEEEDDGIIEMRPTSHRHTPKKQGPRSHSKVSTTSSSSSASTTSASTSSSSPSRGDDLNSTSTSRNPGLASRHASSTTHKPSRRAPPLIRRASDIHVTIAPIAPTMLKTTGAWEEGFGDEGANSDDGLAIWSERMWGYSDGKGKRRGSASEEQISDGTPVELVYVPPFGSNYSLGMGVEEEDEEVYGGEDGYEEEEEDDDVVTFGRMKFNKDAKVENDKTEVDRETVLNTGFGDYADGGHGAAASLPIPILDNPSSRSSLSHRTYMHGPQSSHVSSVPTVVVDQGRRGRTVQHVPDAYDFFSGPDLGEEYTGMRKGLRGYPKGTGGRAAIDREAPSTSPRSASTALVEGERENRSLPRESRSRSRSRSHSRTPSPALLSSTPKPPHQPSCSPLTLEIPIHASNALRTPVVAPTQAPDLERRSSSLSPSSAPAQTSSLLSPPPRGRSYQDLAQPNRSQSRGRSSTRTPTSASSSWDRDRAGGPGNSSTSPIGNLSPDMGIVGTIGVAYAGGRVDREKLVGERERDQRGRGDEPRGNDSGRRGRDRTTGKRLSASVSVSPEPPRSIPPAEEASSPILGNGRTTVAPPMEASFSSTSSSTSTSSSQTVVGDSERRLKEEQHLRRAEEEHRRTTHPTPSNSPIFEMLMPPVGLVPTVGLPPSASTASVGSSSRSSGSGSTPTAAAVSPTRTSPPPPHSHHVRSSSVSSTASSTPTKAKPPPLIPSPSPSLPSTSYVSPVSPKTLLIPPVSLEGGSTIVDKAVGMVSSAGAFFGLWHPNIGGNA